MCVAVKAYSTERRMRFRMRLPNCWIMCRLEWLALPDNITPRENINSTSRSIPSLEDISVIRTDRWYIQCMNKLQNRKLARSTMQVHIWRNCLRAKLNYLLREAPIQQLNTSKEVKSKLADITKRVKFLQHSRMTWANKIVHKSHDVVHSHNEMK